MVKLLSQNLKNKAIYLRRRGYSIPEIGRALDISKSTSLRYSKGISILPKFIGRWLGRRNASKIMSERSWDEANKLATGMINNLTTKERKLIACTLYWAEGNKKDLSFTNTDPGMISVFMDILRSEFKIKNSDFKISIRIYEDLDKNKCIYFWSAVTKINLHNNVSINILPGKKVGKLEFGMCRVRVRKGGLLLKTISAINKRVVAYISPHSSTDRTRHS